MIQTQEFHSSDLMCALDARPHELRAYLRLEPLASRKKRRRSATAYTALDALFLAVIKNLDTAGFAPKALQGFSTEIYKALRHPLHGANQLLLHMRFGGSWKIGAAPKDANAIELKISLRHARLQLLRYTGAHLISGESEMSLLESIQTKGSRNANVVGRTRRRAR